jgi:arginase
VSNYLPHRKPSPASTTDRLRIISCPFHNGLRNVSMGAGATRLSTDDALLAGIDEAGWKLEHDEIPPVDESNPEIVRVIELIRRLGSRVADTVSHGAFPLVFAGNCNSCLGTTAGAGSQDLGVVWFDAHADFDDPEENESGFFDVMGLAMLTGRGWRALRHTIPGHAPIPERNVILAAVRDLEPYQRRRLERSELMTLPGEIDPGRFEEAATELSRRVERVYLHVDLDSIDVADARANKYAAPGGPSLDRVLDCITETCRRFRVVAAAITAYDPNLDGDERTLSAARRITSDIAQGVGD